MNAAPPFVRKSGNIKEMVVEVSFFLLQVDVQVHKSWETLDQALDHRRCNFRILDLISANRTRENQMRNEKCSHKQRILHINMNIHIDSYIYINKHLESLLQLLQSPARSKTDTSNPGRGFLGFGFSLDRSTAGQDPQFKFGFR